jgi:hypothetical protein
MINSVTKEPLEKCLLFLAYQADKVHLEDLMMRESMKKGSSM